jgi:hypothetical protein
VVTDTRGHLINYVGSREWIIPGILPSTLRAVLRTFKIVPDDFVEPVVLINPHDNHKW